MINFLLSYGIWILFIGGMLFMHLGHGGHGGCGGGHAGAHDKTLSNEGRRGSTAPTISLSKTPGTSGQHPVGRNTAS